MATNMELTVNYPASKFEEDNALTNPKVLEKYQLAADIVNGKNILFFFFWNHLKLTVFSIVAVLPLVVQKAQAGVSVCDLCQYGDDLINGHVS